MIRLSKENQNSPEVYNKIFFDREKKGQNWQDLRRWKKLLRYYKGGSLLDIGCLDSNIPIIAKTIFPNAEIWGIDVASEAIQVLKKRYSPDIFYVIMDLYKMHFGDEKFNYVVMGEVLEHLEDPKAAIKEAMRVVKQKGYLAISVPLDEAKEPGAVDGHHHIWSYTIEDIMDLLKPYGGVKISVMGSQHFPIYKYAWPSLVAWVKKK